MGHAVSRKKSQEKKPGTVVGAGESPPPITTAKGAPVVASVHEKQLRVDSQEGLTEEMIEGLTRSSVGSSHSKAKDTVKEWIVSANEFVKQSTDALKLHEESMRLLVAQQVKREQHRSGKADPHLLIKQNAPTASGPNYSKNGAINTTKRKPSLGGAA
ncbi:hypothetical protein, unknown function [Leishmania tarentolae]|uniref:Uncharacterized protein n=1 Tax=Leishmania tarentolae TaxID=5689 RepID=A0A640KNP8_LEITA|nr:hypothetical protein, unknown function [Leishmania tarentolae]